MCFDADLEVVAHTQLLNSVVFLLAGEASAVESIPLDRVLLHKKKPSSVLWKSLLSVLLSPV